MVRQTKAKPEGDYRKFLIIGIIAFVIVIVLVLFLINLSSVPEESSGI